MTILEAIQSYPGLGDESFINTVLVNRSIDGAADYSVQVKQSVQLAVADVYAMIGGLPDFSENKLSITYPRRWYIGKAKELYLANGEADKANALGNYIQVPRGRSGSSW